MQADRFTIKAQEAIAHAGSLAERRRNPQVTPEHLLVVLLEQEGGVVVPVLGKLGANLAAVRAEAGQAVEAGQVLFIIEAMKMENEVAAPHTGTIADIRVQIGQVVEAGTLLATYQAG